MNDELRHVSAIIDAHGPALDSDLLRAARASALR